MQKKLYNSAAIKLPDRDILIDDLIRLSKRILNEFCEVDEVVLFGSLARGDYGTNSDADILLILSQSPYKRYFDRIPRYIPAFLDFFLPVDVFPYTKDEVKTMLENENLFIKDVFDNCISLAKRESLTDG